ncbi:MAG: glycosyltransferase [Terrimicrobiaceae bacterium]|nr:glycosyltransferase [Terrimicrobiaceae bacterium]
MSARADLHVYSRHSTRAADWALRRLDFPASYSDPKALYDKLRGSGMQFVTITDQDTLDGCIEIGALPGVFFSEEVTAAFPEDGCRVHVLVYGLTEPQHRALQELKNNIYQLQAYLAGTGLAHAVAHPFHALNEQLTPLHFQKLILLFRHFETINGRYSAILSESARFALERLRPRDIDRFVAATGIEPTHDEPWRKAFIGGSDDHGGIQPGRAWTVTPNAASPAEFLAHLREGRCEPGGKAGDALVLAHGTYNVAFQYAKDRFALRSEEPGVGLIEKMFSRFMEGRDPTVFTFGEKLGFLAQGILSGKIFEMAKPGNASMWKELSGYFSQPSVKAALATVTTGVPEPERRAFLMANLIANQLGFRFFTQFIEQISAGKFIESIQTISPLVPIVALLSPYIHAFRMPRREWLGDMCHAACGEAPAALSNVRRAWFTDTLEDVNGVATTIRRMTAAGIATGHDLTVVVSRSEIEEMGIPLKNFPPVGEFELPEYELQRLSFPPILAIVDWIARGNFGEIIISTPGPVGLVALAAAKILGLRTAGIYHTDFPQYVRILTDDAFMETLTWNYMHWFYSQLDVLWVNSEDYRKSWASRGIPAQRLRILPRGLDIETFRPSRRDENFWPARGLRAGELAMLYVGRVSKEKGLDVLVAATQRLAEWRLPVRPIFVGDGPYLAEMKRMLPDAIFTGYVRGEELAVAYASADFFVFPSATDTFGNVVLEAHASALPVVVSDMGGPRDLIDDGVDGYITRANDPEELADRIRRLCADAGLREEMGAAARKKVESRDWQEAFERFWAASPH